MKGNTVIHIAFRNIGDSKDDGEFFEGTVREGFLWMAAKIAKISIATRIAIGIGRTKSHAEAAILTGRKSKAGLADLHSELERIMNGESVEEILASNPAKDERAQIHDPLAANPDDPQDDWKGA